ncbi:zinc finger BED domain-containing protein DAYSLEEPER-like [Diospyros lotus]|uniref:zinc finger BED domain-containing protein DAYSLEEPER-like n=1 Tax=Diospyros lotus TaxID=55363 RepID=UPI0022595BC9|nr:zinc finger BED domain-containing protein DAYSLEEPER-like [Diospyros lotus]
MELASNTDPECVRNINENQMTNMTIESSSGSKPPLPPKDSKDKADDYSEPRAVCNYCGKDYANDTRRNGTSTLWNHINNQCKKNPYKLEDKKQKILHFLKKSDSEDGSGPGSTVVATGFSQAACRMTCAKMIVIDELPFSFVEQEGFRSFCSTACPKFDPPSRITIARDIISLYNEEKKKLKSFFVKNSQRVSLTTDTWTSIQNVNYMVLTAHFIDSEWKMQKRILNFCQISYHKGETIGKTIEACLKEWGIEKVFTITVDNAASNNGAFGHMRKKITDLEECYEVQTIMDFIKSILGKLVNFYASIESDEQGGTTSRPRFLVVDPDEDDTVNMFKSGFEKEGFQDNATEMKMSLKGCNRFGCTY